MSDTHRRRDHRDFGLRQGGEARKIVRVSQLEGLSKRLCEELVSMVSTGDSSQGKVARLFRELDRVHVELAGLRRNDVAAGMHRDGKAA